MLNQSRSDKSGSIVIEELKKRLERYQKLVENLKYPTKIDKLPKAKDIAKNIEDDLSQPIVRKYVSSDDLQKVLNLTSILLLMEYPIKPYQARKAIDELFVGITVLLESLPGKPKEKPKIPWKKKKSKKPDEQKEKENNDEYSESESPS